jgi:hypothetical protein
MGRGKGGASNVFKRLVSRDIPCTREDRREGP